MTDGIRVVCPACGKAREVSSGFVPDEDGKILCEHCGGEIPIPVADPDESTFGHADGAGAPDGGVVLTFGTAELAGSQDDTQVSIALAPTMDITVAGHWRCWSPSPPRRPPTVTEIKSPYPLTPTPLIVRRRR